MGEANSTKLLRNKTLSNFFLSVSCPGPNNYKLSPQAIVAVSFSRPILSSQQGRFHKPWRGCLSRRLRKGICLSKPCWTSSTSDTTTSTQYRYISDGHGGYAEKLIGQNTQNEEQSRPQSYKTLFFRGQIWAHRHGEAANYSFHV